MKHVKKVVSLVAVIMAVLAITVPALAGTIVTPNGGRAKLWASATASGSNYVAYVSSGNSASLISTQASSGRYHVKAYGYNSANVHDYYRGWINTSYYKA